MTLKHTPATALPFHQGPISDGDGANDECVFDKGGEIVADCGARSSVDSVEWPECVQNAAYLTHTAKHYPLMVGALKSGQVVPEFIERMSAEDLRKFIREQADVATETLRKIDEAVPAGTTTYRRLVEALLAMKRATADGATEGERLEARAGMHRLLRDLGEPLA